MKTLVSSTPRSETHPGIEDAPTTEAGFALSETVVGGRFKIGERLSWGGMGTVYRALDLETGREVAVKLPHLGAHGATDARFEREAEAVASLVCSSVIGYVAHGSLDEPYLAMELVDGEPLWKRLSRGPLEERGTLLLARRVAAALAAIHLCGWVHRDVKPGNIVVGNDGGIKLLDFGLSRTLDGGGRTTAQGDLIGTLGYMAPEQFLGGRVLDPRTDVFALGVVLFECLTGKRAYHRTAKDLAEKNTGVPLDVRGAGIRDPLAQLVEVLLSHDLEVRPDDGVEALARVLWVGAPSLLPTELDPVREALRYVLRGGSVALCGEGPGASTAPAAAVAAILAEMIAPSDVAVLGCDPSWTATPHSHVRAVADGLASRGFLGLARQFLPDERRPASKPDPERRLVLVVEDAGWCDEASLETLARLAADRAIALVMTVGKNDAPSLHRAPVVSIESAPPPAPALEGLNPVERWTLKAASMFGHSVPLEGVADLVSGPEADEVGGALGLLARRGFLRHAEQPAGFAFTNSTALVAARGLATPSEQRLGARLALAFRRDRQDAAVPRVAWPTSTEERFSALARASESSG